MHIIRDLHERYGATYYIKVATGKQDKQIRQRGGERVARFGHGADFSQSWWSHLVKCLRQHGMLREILQGRFTLIGLSDVGAEWLDKQKEGDRPVLQLPGIFFMLQNFLGEKIRIDLKILENLSFSQFLVLTISCSHNFFFHFVFSRSFKKIIIATEVLLKEAGLDGRPKTMSSRVSTRRRSLGSGESSGSIADLLHARNQSPRSQSMTTDWIDSRKRGRDDVQHASTSSAARKAEANNTTAALATRSGNVRLLSQTEQDAHNVKLYAALLAWRQQAATVLRVPTHRVSTEAALRECAHTRPASVAQLRRLALWRQSELRDDVLDELCYVVTEYCKDNHVPIAWPDAEPQAKKSKADDAQPQRSQLAIQPSQSLDPSATVEATLQSPPSTKSLQSTLLSASKVPSKLSPSQSTAVAKSASPTSLQLTMPIAAGPESLAAPPMSSLSLTAPPQSLDESGETTIAVSHPFSLNVESPIKSGPTPPTSPDAAPDSAQKVQLEHQQQNRNQIQEHHNEERTNTINFDVSDAMPLRRCAYKGIDVDVDESLALEFAEYAAVFESRGTKAQK